MAKIKTRDTVKDVKVFDRTANASKHMKNAFLKSKETAESVDRQAEQTQDAEHSSPSEYASDHMTGGAKATAERTAHILKQNPVKNASKNINKAKRDMQEVRWQAQSIKDTVRKPATDPPKKEMVRRARDTARRNTTRTRQAADQSVKTVQKSEKTIKQVVRGTEKTIKTASKTIKGTAKATRNTAKTAQRTAKVTVKTAQQTAKATQRAAQAAAKAAKAAAQAAKAAAKAAIQTAKIAVKVTIAIIKMTIAATKALIAAIAAGSWVAVVVILVICMIGLIVGSAFGIFFSNDAALDNSITVSQAVIEINGEFQADIQSRINALFSQDSYDEVHISYEGDIEGDSDTPNNWSDVLTVYAVKFTGEDMEVLTFDESHVAALRDIFNEMNKVSVRHEVVTEEVPVETPSPAPSPSQEPKTQTKKTLIVYVTVRSLTYEQAAPLYSFTAEQIQIADEMMSPQYYSLFAQLLGVDIYGGADLTQIISNLPPGEKGSAIVEAALTRLGHPYSQALRGQKNYVDCSYLAWWAYKQAGVNIPSTSVMQAKYCYGNGYNIGKSELQPGDLIFWSKLSCHCGRWQEIHHTGIYIGDGKTIEASSSKGRVVINNLWGENGATWRIHSYARPS
ncbi:MAG: NlpC/P60 family protein [Christensenellales bacterium]|jgi:cell wall-associated NlpC family hydrolase